MRVTVASGRAEGRELKVPEGLHTLSQVIGLPVEATVYRFENRSFIKGKDLRIRGERVDRWVEVDSPILVEAGKFLVLFKPESED